MMQITMAANISISTNETNGTEKEFPLLSLPILITVMISLVTLMVVTVTGNLLVVISYLRDRHLRTTYNFYIFNLAIADMGIGFFSVGFYLIYAITIFQWPLGRVMCKIYLIVDFTLCMETVLLMNLLSLDRLILLKTGVRYKFQQTMRMALVKVMLTWLLSFILYGPAIIGWDHWVGYSSVEDRDCDTEFHNNFLFTLITSVVESTIPFISFVVLNMQIYMKIQKSNKMFKSGIHKTLISTSNVSITMDNQASFNRTSITSDSDDKDNAENLYNSNLGYIGDKAKSVNDDKQSTVCDSIHSGVGDSKSANDDENIPLNVGDSKPVNIDDKSSVIVDDNTPVNIDDPPVNAGDNKPVNIDDKPVNIDDNTPVNFDDNTPVNIDDTPVNVGGSKPVNIDDNKPVNVDDKPVNVDDNKPLNVDDNTSDNVDDNKPVNVDDNKPVNVDDNKPVNVDDKPVNVDDNKPVNIDDNKPGSLGDNKENNIRNLAVSNLSKVNESNADSYDTRMRSSDNNQGSPYTFYMNPTSNKSGKRKRGFRRIISAGSGMQRRRKKAARTLLFLVITFAICWVPYTVANVLRSFCSACVDQTVFQFLFCLVWVKSCVNPFLYAYTNERFRNNFNKLLFKHCKCKIRRR